MEEYALKNLMIQLINKQNDESSKSNGLINDDKKDDANSEYALKKVLMGQLTKDDDLDDSSYIESEKLSDELVGGGLIYSFSPDGSLIETIPSKENIIPAFMMNRYVFNSNGTVSFQSSSANDAIKPTFTEAELKNIIVTNPTLREYCPDINADDVYIQNGMLMFNLRRTDSTELYRLDVINSEILVQAEFEEPCPLRGTDIEYGFIAVPIDSDLGKKILETPNYKISNHDKIDPSVSIFRINQYSS